MSTDIALTKLTPHPKNDQLPAVDAATYAAMKEDIAEHGILHPITVNVRTWHIVMGHHRVQIAQELGWETVPADLIDVEETEEERLMIADNILRRQIDKPMDKAKLLQWIKDLYDIGPGKHGKSFKMNDLAQSAGMSEPQARRTLALNKLIDPLQAMVSAGTLSASTGSDLAWKLTPAQQQELYDKLGAAQMSRLKTADIQQAKKAPDTSDLQDQIATLESERQALQDQLDTAPDHTLLADLQDQLAATDDTRQQYADELARPKSQTPVERIVEKVIEVEKPVPDPAQAAVIARLEQELTDAQRRIESLVEVGVARQSLDRVEFQRKEAEKALKEARAALSAVYQNTEDRTGYRAALGRFVEMATKRARPILSDWKCLAEHPRHPLNWSLYHDVQGLAGVLESVAAGLWLLEMDAQAVKKRNQRVGQIVDATALVVSESHEGRIIDVDTDDI